MVLALAAVAGACSDPGDAWVVVQETNMPCSEELCPPCELAHDYSREVLRECSSMAATISVCSERAVCDAALDALVDTVIACEDGSGEELELDLSLCE
jgi:hypothetical protein